MIKLTKSIRRLTRHRTEQTLIPLYGIKNGKKCQVVGQTLIEVGDLPKALEYRWNLDKGYAKAGNRLHRHLLNTPEGFDTDHINGNKLDNRRSNLRIASRSQNLMNRGKTSNNKSGFKGVCWNKYRQKWHAQITKPDKKKHLGYFTDKNEAAKAYNKASLKYHGEFAYQNIIKGE